MTKSNIVLIGMPGAGKSTVGVLIAKSLGMAFTDTDLLLQQNEGRLLQEIINEDGIEAFLDIEEKTLFRVNAEHTVIATGGSAVYSVEAMDHLKITGHIIYLRLDYEAMVDRLQNISTRGIVLAAGQSLMDLYQERAPLYERYAEAVVDCSNHQIEETVKQAIDLCRKQFYL